MKKAFIMAAGFGSRMREVTQEIPKPLVTVHGVRMIETLLDAFLNAGIDDITIIRGYKKKSFDVLLEKYPSIKFVDNDEYDKGNNITSLMKVVDELEDCYISEADFLVTNPDIIEKNPSDCFYCGFPIKETDDWCFDDKSGYASHYRKGGKYTFQAIGISYWPLPEGRKLQRALKSAYSKTKDVFWEEIPLVRDADEFKVKIHQIKQKDIKEIDSLEELIAEDSSYEKYRGTKYENLLRQNPDD